MIATTFDRLGGFAKIRVLVSDFYERLLENDRLASYFAGVDMRRLIDHQTKFVASVTGGPASFTNEHLGRVHQHLNISEADFDELAEVLRDTLEDNDVDATDVDRILAQVGSVRHHIVSRRAPDKVRTA